MKNTNKQKNEEEEENKEGEEENEEEEEKRGGRRRRHYIESASSVLCPQTVREFSPFCLTRLIRGIAKTTTTTKQMI